MKPNLSLRGWLRASSRSSENEQRAAFAAVGCTKIYVAGIDSLAKLVADLRKGDVVVMTTFGRTSGARTDLVPFRRAVHGKYKDKPCHIWELSTGRRSTDADDMAEMIHDAEREQAGDGKALTTKQAREFQKLAAESLRKNSRAKRTSEAEAKSIWYDDKIKGVKKKLAHKLMRGWTQPTAYRLLKRSKY
jgi:hypothetical protein